MDEQLVSALFYTGVPVIAALMTYRWGWKGGVIMIGLGVAGLVGLWLILSLLAYLDVGPNDPEFRFTVGAGWVIVAGFGSLVWSLLAGFGMIVGLFARLFIARKPA